MGNPRSDIFVFFDFFGGSGGLEAEKNTTRIFLAHQKNWYRKTRVSLLEFLL